MTTTPPGSQHGGEPGVLPSTPRQPQPLEILEPKDIQIRHTQPPEHFDRLEASNGPQLATQLNNVLPPRAASEPLNKMEPLLTQHQNGRDTPSTTSQLPDFDWEDFEARYTRALEEADEHEMEILKEAEILSKYFRAWASAASVQDNERAVKRLQTRQRFVNLSEEKMAQKQQHCEPTQPLILVIVREADQNRRGGGEGVRKCTCAIAISWLTIYDFQEPGVQGVW
ncbi:hypothetical protein LIA77_00783 [Sarocladium implicatum]|nr:hypothetical protein LIA77_00783 [Sarocladium implicatum]